MKLFTIILVFCVIIFDVNNAQAQKTWTLEECINYALDNNIDIKESQLQMDVQNYNLLESQASMLPNLNANGNTTINWGKTVDRYTNQFADTRTNSVNLYLQTSVTLFNGFQMLNTVKKNKLLLSSQQFNVDYQKDLKSMDVTTAFLQVLYDQENLANKINQLELTQEQVDRTQKLFEAGSVANGDLLNIKSQLSTDLSNKIDAENQLNLSKLRLKQLMYLPGDSKIELSAPEIDLTSKIYVIEDPYKVYNYAIENRPEIKNAEIKVESSQKDLQIARGMISPSVSLSATIGSGYSGASTIIDGTPVFAGFQPTGDFTTGGDTVISPIFDYKTKLKPWDNQLRDNKNYSIGMNVRIPIFNGLQTYTAISKSKISMQQAELELEKSKINMRQTIEQAYADASSSLKKYEALVTQVASLQESFKYSTQRYEEKMITAFEYNDAKIKLEIAQSNLISAKYTYVFKVKVLDFYYGKPLSL